MDRVTNPFAPGAGAPPPELAGRDELRETIRIALERTRRGLPAKSVLMVGLRGVGKTVLLDRMREDADASGIQTLRIEAPEGRSFPSLLAPQLRQTLLLLSTRERARDLAIRGLRALAGFASALKARYHDIEVGFDYQPEPGLADNGDLEHDLQALFEATGAALQSAGTALGIFADELQYVDEKQLEAVITALHRAAQRKLPIILVGAGLPQLRGQMGQAKSYAERLFDFPSVGALSVDAAYDAVIKPLERMKVLITAAAIDRIVTETRGYPYFLQEWAKYAWDIAGRSPIELTDVQQASRLAIAALDESFFRVRFDRLTPVERRYLRAMAELGPGPHRSGEIAGVLDKSSAALGPVRAELIEKGMIWSPGHGDTAFTVPMFDEFMRRIVPGTEWKSA